MAVTSVTVLAPADGISIPDGIARPAVTYTWIGGTGPWDAEIVWDDDPLFGNANGNRQIVNEASIASISDRTVAPTADLADRTDGHAWYLRVTVTDTFDSGSAADADNDFTYFDPKLKRRYLYLLANVGVGFTPTDDPAGGWGTGGTVGPDGNTRDFDRYLHLLANVGVGFTPTDDPAGGWGTGGTVGPDGNTRDFDRYLHLLANVDSTQPCPFLVSLSKTTAETGDTIIVSGQGLVSGDDPTDTWSAEVRLYDSPSFAASYVVMSKVTWDAGETLDTITTTIPGGATSGFVAVVHTAGATCSGSNFIGLTVIAQPVDRQAGWWAEVWNLRNTAPLITPLADVVRASFEQVADDIGRGDISLPRNHADISDIIDRTQSPPVQKLVKVYLHGQFAYAFIPDDIDEDYDEDGARDVRIYGSGQESILTWGRVLWNDYPAQPTSARVWLWGSEINVAEWGDMEPVNQIENGDVEDAEPEPWIKVGTPTFFATTAEAHAGTYSLEVTPSALNEGAETEFSTLNGKRVFADVWLKTNSPGGTYEVEILDPALTVLANATVIPGSSLWVKTELSYVPTADETVTLRVTQTAGALVTFFLDDADGFNDIAASLNTTRCTYGLSRSYVADGSHSLEVVCDAGGDTKFNGIVGFFGVTNNQAYILSLKVTGPAGKKMRIALRLGGTLTKVEHTFTGVGTFDVVSLSGVAGSDETTARFALNSLESTALTFYIDVLKIRPGEDAATAGKIVTDVHTAMAARGTLDFIQLNFTPTTDSGNQPWAENLSFEAQPEWTLWDLTEKLIGLGYSMEFAPVNWRAGGDSGWELSLFNPSTAGTDWSTVDDGPAILPGDTVLDADPSSAPPASTVVFGEGAEGFWSVAAADAATLTALERREEFVNNQSMKNTNTLFRAVSKRLDLSETRGASFSADLTDDGDPLPYLDIRPQDRVRAHLPQDTAARDVVADDVYRIAAITCLLTGGGRQQQYAVDVGHYQLHANRRRDLLLGRLIRRATTENYEPGTGSVSQPRSLV